jgi:3-hydroxyacyl-CoA dehydrogenase
LPFCQYWCRVLLLDIVPRELTEAETKVDIRGKIVHHPLVEHLNNALKSKPLLFTPNNSLTESQLETQRYGKIADVDWIIEVVVEG